MQFNPVVLFVGSLPAGASSQRYKKRGEFGQNIQKKAENKKKRASSPEPLASCKKSQKAFLFYLHQIVTRKSIFLFTSKNKLQTYQKHLMFNFYLYLITYF